ncbi:MarR family winged helix-turn-helix transcriptional regulator [Glutamicibacter sp. JL.03c]|uniref:MarR family winged helix-turn-helix transcriptional regulator n=1 Tax=Glutamicibacter sp. JL.03c TaxID=2984842 RepID=UPI0021F6ECB9|nr:MarR family winged helix-turn-helix transcriptional regulator [Glutamicibacter sp. JL.03c]UYQ76848.1 MarR family winged helix-turn-helix transcriptional regulator [Glutamicibacter sp. JL.03c]
MKSDETRWLTESEQDLWRTIREFLWLFPSAMDRQLVRDSQMQSGEYSVLAVLSEASDPSLRPADVAQVLRWDRSRLSHLLRRMEGKGLISRCSDETDGRGHQIALTDLGRETIENAAPSHVTFVRETLFDSLNATERRALETALPKILESIEQHGFKDTSC